MTQSRTYTRVTPEMEATIIATRDRMGTVPYSDIAEVTGLPERTVKYVLVDLPRLRRVREGEEKSGRSLKERIYNAIQDIGEFKDVGDLRRVLGMADDEHNIVHVLHSLHSQGRIDFDERTSNGSRSTAISNIRLPKKRGRATGEIVNAGIPFDQPVVPVAPVDQVTEPESYPLLDSLLDRERTRLDSDTKGMAFVVAAEAIQSIDPETAAVLMAKANQYNVPFPSPIEQEYLRYVGNHRKETTS